MDEARPHNEQPAWRQVVQMAALEAAVVESRAHWGRNDVAFNYRWEHVQAAVRLSIRLAELTGADREIVEAAAWLHDVARPHSQHHAQDGAMAARQILARTDFAVEKIDAVADAIAKHVGLFTDESLEPIEAAVVWDADKLSKVGATAALHFTGHEIMVGEGSTAGWVERLSNLPWQQATVTSFQTLPARAVGRKRLETFQSLWKQVAQEFNGDDLAKG
jgi:HD superfamily phosphodiesterase